MIYPHLLKERSYTAPLLFYVIIGPLLVFLGYRYPLSLALLIVGLFFTILFFKDIPLFLAVVLMSFTIFQPIRTKISGEVFSVYGFITLLLCILSPLLICIKGIRIDKLSIFFPFSIFIAAGLIPLPSTYYFLESARVIYRLIFGLLLYCLVYYSVRKKIQIRNLLFSMVLSLLVPIIIGFWQRIIGKGPIDELGCHVYLATFEFHNYLGAYILICLVAINWFIFSRDKLWMKITAWTIGILALFLLYLSYSRAIYIGFFVFLLVYNALMRKKFFIWFMVLLILYFAFSPAIPQRLAVLLRPSQETPPLSLIWRIFHWKMLLPYVLERPFFGHGWRSGVYLATRAYGWYFASAHNEYLETTLDVGIVGLIAYIWMLAIFLRNSMRIYSKASDFELKNLAASFIALLSAWLTIGLAGEYIGSAGIFSAFLVIAALVECSQRLLCKDT